MRLLFWTSALTCSASLLAGLLAQLLLQTRVPLLGSWVWLQVVENPGVAFGMTLAPGFQIAFILGALLVVLLMALRSRHSWRDNLAFGLILGGAVANVLDRLPDGFVTDFVAVRWFSVFNVADAAITIGALLLGLDVFRFPVRKRAMTAPPDEDPSQSSEIRV